MGCPNITTAVIPLVRIIYEAAKPQVDCAKQRITDLYPILPVPINTLMTSYLY